MPAPSLRARPAANRQSVLEIENESKTVKAAICQKEIPVTRQPQTNSKYVNTFMASSTRNASGMPCGEESEESTEALRHDNLLPELCQVNLDFMFNLETKLCTFNLNTGTVPSIATNQ